VRGFAVRALAASLYFCNTLFRYVESFKRAGVEVLYVPPCAPTQKMCDILARYTFTPFDELVHSRMADVGGKAIKLIDHTSLPDNLAPKRDESSTSLSDDAVKELCAFLKTALGTRVLDVTATSRLFDSPCALWPFPHYLYVTLYPGAVSGHENAGARQMRKMFMARSGAPPMSTPPVTMLINPHHSIIVALSRCRCCIGVALPFEL
jgi:HSP90 family molecular chaperone